MSGPLNDPAVLARQLIEFYEKISSWEHEVVKSSSLSPAQMHTIEIIGHAGSLRMKELAGMMGVTTGSLTVMVDRLVRMNLLERQPHASDRRSWLVTLTESGQKLFAEHHQYYLQFTREITSSLTGEEEALFAGLLAKIIHRM